MKFSKIRKILRSALMSLVILGVFASGVEPLVVNAWVRPGPTYRDVVVNEPIVLSFSTASVTSSSRNNGIMDVVQVALTYVAYPQSNPTSQLRGTVYMLNNGEISFSRSMAVTTTRSDGVTYSGTYNFDVHYNSRTALLRVNGSAVTMGTSILRHANVYPEARVEASVLAVEMSPMPFSLVRATAGMSASSIEAFNQRINGGITQALNLRTEQFGTGASSSTRLSMYVNVWRRRADGTYDKSQAATRVQVIYSAADLLNGVASHSGWSGTQLYRQLTDAPSTGFVLELRQTQSGNRTVREFDVQNRTGWNTQWGFQGVVGNWSLMFTGTHGTTENRSYQVNYRYSRYQIRCSNWLRTASVLHWSPINTVGDAFCRNQNSARPFFREVAQTDTSAWTTATSMSGRTRTHTGFRFQERITTPIWGATYRTATAPSEREISEMDKRVIRTVNTVVPNIITTRWYGAVDTTIARADGLSEASVNARTSDFARGMATARLLGSGLIPEDTYWAQINSETNRFLNDANRLFREGARWGLYLYVTSHWRAIEVPISWHEISGSTITTSSLGGRMLVPPVLPNPDTETEIALTDFAYVQSIFDQTVASHPHSTLSDIQSRFLTRLSTDLNNAAQKTKEYYDALLRSGRTHAQAFEIIGEDFNLNINKK